MLRLVFAAGLGLVLGAVLLLLLGVRDVFVWLLPIGGALLAGSGIAMIFSRALRSVFKVPAQAMLTARHEGRMGVARIDHVQHSNIQINNRPVCNLLLTVKPDYAPVYRGQLRALLPYGVRTGFRPGSLYEMAFFGPEGRDVAFTWNPLPESATKVSFEVPPEKAETVRLSAAKVRRNGKVAQRTRSVSGGQRFGRAVLGVLVAVLAAAVVLQPHGATVSRAAQLIGEGTYYTDLRGPERIDDVIDAFREATGHSAAVGLRLELHRVLADLPVAAGQRATDTWRYSGAAARNTGAATQQPTSADEQFSLEAIDFDALWRGLAEARQLSGIDDADPSRITIQRRTNGGAQSTDQGQALGPVQASFTLADDYSRASFTMDGDGKNLQQVPEDQAPSR